MYTITLSLVAVYVLCVEDAKTVTNSDKGCTNLKKCNPPSNFLEISDGNFVHCQKSGGFLSCYAKNNHKCKDSEVLKNISATANILKYVCSEEGQKNLWKIENESLCVQHQTNHLVAKGRIELCILTFKLRLALALTPPVNNSALCKTFDDLGDCLSQPKMKRLCGEDYVYFIKKVTDARYKSDIGQYGCEEEVRPNRHLNTRMLPLVLA